MLKIMVDCEFPGELNFGDLGKVRGLISVQFEEGERALACLNAIENTKAQMVRRGYSFAEIQSFIFSIEEVEELHSNEEGDDSEIGFVYY